jgi:hypothetical protein
MTFGALTAFLSHSVVSKWLMVYPRFWHSLWTEDP